MKKKGLKSLFFIKSIDVIYIICYNNIQKGDDIVNQMLYLDKDFVEKAKKKAKEKGLSLSSYIRMIVLERWSKEEKGE